MKKKLLVVASALAMLAVFALPASAGHSWNGYKWAGTGGGLELQLVDRMSPNWSALLPPVLEDWDGDDTYNTFDLLPTSGSPTAICANPLGPGVAAAAGYIELCNDTYGQNGWLGVARIWIDGSTITAAVSAMNDSYFQTPTYDDDVARRHVLCQEIGHTFGLDHQKSPRDQSCMNDRWGLFTESYQTPNSHDYDQLAAIYGTASGGGGGEDGGGGDFCDRKPNHQRCSSPNHTFEVRHLGGGRAVVTWITWAPGHGPSDG